MSPEILIAFLATLTTILGVFFVVLAYVEYRKLAKLHESFFEYRQELKSELDRVQRSMQLVIASYAISDTNQNIQLLKKAVEICPDVFNGYNALGYAFIEAGDITKALDAFVNAVRSRPNDKAGYFDIAFAYLKLGDKDLALRNLQEAVEIDPSSKEDLVGNKHFEELMPEIRKRKLID